MSASSAPMLAAGAGRFFHDRCFDRLDFSRRGDVAVAVSGGGDSLALLYLANDYLKRRFPAIRLHAVTVDHALRSGSADEALKVGRLAANLGVSHRVMQWTGEKPATGVSAAAREARHALLAQAAREAGADLVLVGHTLDDQAETVGMRAARGSGRGDAGIADATLYDWRTWFARPLLYARRGALRDVLRQAAIGWIDDPSNDDQRYERVRMRAALSANGGAEELARKAMAAGAARRALGERAAMLITRHATMPSRGLMRLAPEFALALDRDAAVYALRIVLVTAGGGAQLADLDRAAALFDRLKTAPLRATLSRAVIDVRRSGIFLHRESRGLPRRSAFEPGLWDGRYALTGQAGGAYPDVGATGTAPDMPKSAKNQSEVPDSLAKAAAAAQPALWRDGGFLGAIDGWPGIASAPAVAPWARFLPSFDYRPACAMAALVGAPMPPPPPFAGHKDKTP